MEKFLLKLLTVYYLKVSCKTCWLIHQTDNISCKSAWLQCQVDRSLATLYVAQGRQLISYIRYFLTLSEAVQFKLRQLCKFINNFSALVSKTIVPMSWVMLISRCCNLQRSWSENAAIWKLHSEVESSLPGSTNSEIISRKSPRLWYSSSLEFESSLWSLKITWENRWL